MLSPEQIKFGSNKSKSLSSQCLKCKFLKLCNGECPKNRIIRLPDGSTQNYLCQGLKHYFNHVEPYMQFMTNELKNNRSPENVIRWVRSRK